MRGLLRRVRSAVQPMLRRDALWIVSDQALWSGYTFLGAVLAARLLHPDAYGAYALGVATWITVMALSRALVSQPFVVAASSKPPGVWDRDARGAAGAALLVGSVIGSGLVLVGLLLGLGTNTGTVLVLLGGFAPVLVVQDFFRNAAYSVGAPRRSVINGCIVVSIWGTSLAAVVAVGASSAGTVFLAWGLGGAAGAFVAFRQFALTPALGRPALAWLSSHRHTVGWFGCAELAYLAGMQSVYVLVVVVLGDADLGGLRLVMALLGPVQLVVASIQFVGLPSASRRHAEHGMHQAIAPALRLSGTATAVASVYLLVLAVGSEQLLVALVGAAYSSFAGLALPVALAFVVSVVALGPTLAIKAAGAGRAFAVVQVVVLALRLSLTAVLAPTVGLMGVAWGLVVASLVEASLLWFALRRLARRAERTPVAGAQSMRESV
ncbi:hypothetical protein [Blastococcus tunisiensis]|uniref:Membrane protein involved in the export of O-antigen and teichoic acid n=1 Tax=Blastococcus tunisiensis TaxID=1798228 RepID=A0A1I2JFF0_9ACTN|nr:hypothetical protein [Blastococcus sp. DSM 46838]SFF51391.1 Membrane protein involved in the export of O-antigen and teichoic acid [Blastococcus sp. DSM 46838]